MSKEKQPKKPNIQIWQVENVRPYDKNAKTHPPEQVEKIANSIREFGWDQPIVVDRDGIIIKGHGRRLAAIKLGFKEVPVWVRDDLTPEQVRAARLADNQVAQSDLDTRLLAEELKTLDYDLSDFFEAKELDFMKADLVSLNDDAFVPDLDDAIKEQAKETSRKIDEVDKRDVNLDAALGYRKVSGADERHLVVFQALIEAKTGKKGAEALVEHAKAVALESVTDE